MGNKVLGFFASGLIAMSAVFAMSPRSTLAQDSYPYPYGAMDGGWPTAPGVDFPADLRRLPPCNEVDCAAPLPVDYGPIFANGDSTVTPTVYSAVNDFRDSLRIGIGGPGVIRDEHFGFEHGQTAILELIAPSPFDNGSDVSGDGLVTSGLFRPTASGAHRIAFTFDDLHAIKRNTLATFSIAQVRRWNLKDGRVDSSGWNMEYQGSTFSTGTPFAPFPNDPSAFVPSWNRWGYSKFGIQLVNADSELEVTARGGGVLADSYWKTDIDRWTLGPQFAVGHLATYQRWAFDCNASLMLGYCWSRFEQQGTFGTLTDGGNEFIDSEISHDFDEDDLGYLLRARVTSSYFFKPNFSFDLSATAAFFGPWSDASEATRYVMPNLGIDANRDGIGGFGYLTLGFTYYYQ